MVADYILHIVHYMCEKVAIVALAACAIPAWRVT
jgi:hypothetical protein